MRTRRAFTLIELLVVIAIIGIIAAMMLPVLANGKKRALQTQCISNYKQTGIALQMFCDEHEDQLPPGKTNSLYLSQRPVYGKSDTFNRHLAYYLAPYLSLPAPEQLTGDGTNLVKVMLCPAYIKSLPGNSESRYDGESDNYIHAWSFMVSRYQVKGAFPFGWPGSNLAPAVAPSKLNDISAVKPLSDAWALGDLDEESVFAATSLGPDRTPYVAIKPVHENIRPFLYFDMHVATVKNTDYVPEF